MFDNNISPRYFVNDLLGEPPPGSLFQLVHDLGIDFLGNTPAREKVFAGFDTKLAGSQINLNNVNDDMISIDRGHNFTVFGAFIRDSPHDRQDFMGCSQQLILAFAADTLKSILGCGIPADCPGTTDNQEPAAAEKGAKKNHE
jgi:hypothetical protein